MPPRQPSGGDMPSLPEYAPLTVASTNEDFAQAFIAPGWQRLGTNRCAAGTRSRNLGVPMLHSCPLKFDAATAASCGLRPPR